MILNADRACYFKFDLAKCLTLTTFSLQLRGVRTGSTNYHTFKLVRRNHRAEMPANSPEKAMVELMFDGVYSALRH